jgi:hypothetical protein
LPRRKTRNKSSKHFCVAHDIIDNRKEKLADHINSILSPTKAARFAVGYFLLSGLESIAHHASSFTPRRAASVGTPFPVHPGSLGLERPLTL